MLTNYVAEKKDTLKGTQIKKIKLVNQKHLLVNEKIMM